VKPGHATRKYVGRLFAARRAQLGITQDEVARRVSLADPNDETHMDASDYGRIENGKRGLSIARLELIARVLGFTPAMLFAPIESPIPRRHRGRPRKKR
jgi:transcriptional regulator with XRE-family HTH domain